MISVSRQKFEVSGLDLGLVGEGLGLGLVQMVSVSSFRVSCLEAFRDLLQYLPI
jgi:hypothetical protein